MTTWFRTTWMTAMACAMMTVALVGCPKNPQVAVQTAGVDEMESTTPSPDAEEVMPPTAMEEQPMPSRPAEPSFELSDIYFEYDRAEITAAARTALERNAQWLRSQNNPRVRIEGHTDERGTNEYNIALGERRAQSVKRVLAAMGVPAANLSTVSYGEEQPTCSTSDESCWSKNRRAHLAVR